MNHVKIYPAFDAFYYSFYIQGILDVFGESSVRFSYDGFPPLPANILAFIVKGNPERRLIIDAYDGASIADSHYSAVEWCDRYGKVNLVSSVVPKNYLEKFLAIGPSFPIKVWRASKAWWLALRNYKLGSSSPWEHFANYRRQYRYRLPLKDFVPGATKDNYIFFSSSIWDDEEAPGTNQYRSLFMDTCKSLENVTFEGGFSRPISPERAAQYEKHISPKRYPLPEWLDKIKQSAVAFYTPAVWLSHTFKLAEFLALGKAIISTPISRELPASLIHGEHIHYIDGSPSSFRDALNLILADSAYRTCLEQNARDYYRTRLTPQRVIRRLLGER